MKRTESMKKLFLLAIVMILLQGCVMSFPGFTGKTDNGFFLTIRDQAGNEISTGVSVNDPEHVPKLKEMYIKLVAALNGMTKEMQDGK